MDPNAISHSFRVIEREHVFQRASFVQCAATAAGKLHAEAHLHMASRLLRSARDNGVTHDGKTSVTNIHNFIKNHHMEQHASMRVGDLALVENLALGDNEQTRLTIEHVPLEATVATRGLL